MNKTLIVLIGLVVFLIGAVGGVWSQTSLIPYLVAHPAFQQWQIVKSWNAKTLVMRPVQEIKIDSSAGSALRAAKAQQSVVGVESVSPDGKVVRGSGLVATSDGLVLTLASLAPQGYQARVWFKGAGEPAVSSVVKRDLQKNLVLLKVERDKLQTVSLTNERDITLGAQIFLLSASFEKDAISFLYHQGALSSVGTGKALATFTGSYAMQGGVVFDERASALGIALVGEGGKLNVIPSPVLRSFLGL